MNLKFNLVFLCLGLLSYSAYSADELSTGSPSGNPGFSHPAPPYNPWTKTYQQTDGVVWTKARPATAADKAAYKSWLEANGKSSANIKFDRRSLVGKNDRCYSTYGTEFNALKNALSKDESCRLKESGYKGVIVTYGGSTSGAPADCGVALTAAQIGYKGTANLANACVPPVKQENPYKSACGSWGDIGYGKYVFYANWHPWNDEYKQKNPEPTIANGQLQRTTPECTSQSICVFDSRHPEYAKYQEIRKQNEAIKNTWRAKRNEYLKQQTLACMQKTPTPPGVVATGDILSGDPNYLAEGVRYYDPNSKITCSDLTTGGIPSCPCNGGPTVQLTRSQCQQAQASYSPASSGSSGANSVSSTPPTSGGSSSSISSASNNQASNGSGTVACNSLTLGGPAPCPCGNSAEGTQLTQAQCDANKNASGPSPASTLSSGGGSCDPSVRQQEIEKYEAFEALLIEAHEQRLKDLGCK